MSLEERCIEAFGAAQRQAGFHDFIEDRITLVDRREGWAETWVLGGGDTLHGVTVDWRRVSDGVLTVTCDCPVFPAEGRCHHLWGTLLTLDQELGDTLVPGVEPLALVVGETPAASPPQGRIPPGPWRQQIAAVADLQRALLLTGRAAAPGDGGQERLAWYRLDLSASASTGRLTLEVLITEGDGALRPALASPLPSPPSPRAPRSFATFHPAPLTDPEDRWLVELLAAFPAGGGRPQAWLPPVLFAEVLPRLCATGRCGWQPRPASSPGTLQTLTWQEGSPWRFVLGARRADSGSAAPAAPDTPDAPDDRILRLSGRLRRGDEERSLREALLLLPAAGLVVFADRIARLDPAGDTPWITVLRQVGEILVPAAERDAVARSLAHLPRPPDPFPALLRSAG